MRSVRPTLVTPTKAVTKGKQQVRKLMKNPPSGVAKSSTPPVKGKSQSSTKDSVPPLVATTSKKSPLKAAVVTGSKSSSSKAATSTTTTTRSSKKSQLKKKTATSKSPVKAKTPVSKKRNYKRYAAVTAVVLSSMNYLGTKELLSPSLNAVALNKNSIIEKMPQRLFVRQSAVQQSDVATEKKINLGKKVLNRVKNIKIKIHPGKMWKGYVQGKRHGLKK